jgi:hypothetical protein
MPLVVVRVTTPLYEDTTGSSLGGTVVAYDLIRYKPSPLVTLLACFDAPSHTLAGGCEFARVQVCAKAYPRWTGGLPRRAGTFAADDEKQPIQAFTRFAAVSGDAGTIAFVGGHPAVAQSQGSAILQGDAEASHIAQDLREFSPAHPFCAHLLLGGPEADPAELIGHIPQAEHLPACTQGTLSIQSGALTVNLAVGEDGVDLVRIRDEKAGTDLLCREGNTLFTLMLRTLDLETEYVIDSLHGWGQVSTVPGKDRVVFAQQLVEQL